MGNSSTVINITLDRNSPAIYHAGDTISGQVHFTIAERTTTVEYIFLTVTGDVGYTTTHVARMQNGISKQTTNHHDIRILGEKIILGHAFSSEQQHRISSRSDTTILEPGRYTYPFAVRLPDVLPPTIHPKDYPFVRYELQLFVEKKWYCANSHYRHPLRIHPRVNLSHISNSQCAVKFDTKRKDIIIKGIIQRSGLIPGEQTKLFIEIDNPHNLGIKRVDVCLIQHYSVEQNRRRLELTRSTIPQLINVHDEHIETTCPVIIPAGISPSYNYRGRGGRTMVHVHIYYDIKLEVKSKKLFSDFDVYVPIIIGTEMENDLDSMAITASSIDLDNIDALDDEADGEDDNVNDDANAKSHLRNM